MADSLAAELAAIRERNERARHPEDDDGKLYIAAAAVAVALGEAPGWTVRRSGVSVEVYEDGRGVPAWRVWVERGKDGHLIGDGEFGRSARDVPRLLAAVEALARDHRRATWYGNADECGHARPLGDGTEQARAAIDEYREGHPSGDGMDGEPLTVCLDKPLGEYCPGCTEIVQQATGDDTGDPVPAAECMVRPLITRHLTGEATDAR